MKMWFYALKMKICFVNSKKVLIRLSWNFTTWWSTKFAAVWYRSQVSNLILAWFSIFVVGPIWPNLGRIGNFLVLKKMTILPRGPNWPNRVNFFFWILIANFSIFQKFDIFPRIWWFGIFLWHINRKTSQKHTLRWTSWVGQILPPPLGRIPKKNTLGRIGLIYSVLI